MLCVWVFSHSRRAVFFWKMFLRQNRNLYILIQKICKTRGDYIPLYTIPLRNEGSTAKGENALASWSGWVRGVVLDLANLAGGHSGVASGGLFPGLATWGHRGVADIVCGLLGPLHENSCRAQSPHLAGAAAHRVFDPVPSLVWCSGVLGICAGQAKEVQQCKVYYSKV